MRILHVVHQYPPDYIGGTELYSRSLANRQRANGHAVAVFAPASSQREWYISGNVEEYRPFVSKRSAPALFFSTFRNQGLNRAFTASIDKFRPELIHIQHLQGLPAAFGDQLAALNLPYVVTLHDYWYFCANAQLITNYDQTICAGPDRFLNCARCALSRIGSPTTRIIAPIVAPIMAWRNRLLGSLLDGAARVIAPTHFVKSTYQRLGFSAEKITVIAHGMEIFSEQPKTLGNRDDFFKITFIGGLSWQKGIHVLIEAVNKMPTNRVILKIIGDKSAYPAYVAELEERVSHPGISFEGSLGRDEVWSALGSSDVVVVPSLWYEASPAVVREAFAAGVPVIASKIGALTEQINDGVDGLLVAPGEPQQLYDALMSLYREPQLLKRLGNGIKPVRAMADHAAEIEGVYKEILGT